MDRIHIPASLLLTILAAGKASAASSGTTSSADRGRTLSDYNIQKDSTALPRPRLRIRLAPK